MLDVLDTINRIRALTIKELLATLKDPRGRFSLIMPTIIQCIIYGYAATYDLNSVPYVVLDQDRSAASVEFLAAMDGSGVFKRVANYDRAEDMKDAVNERRAVIAIQIGPDFERRLQSGQMADVQLIADGRNSNTAGIAMGYVFNITEQFNTKWRSQHGIPEPPLRITRRAWYNPNLMTRWNMVPGMIGTLALLQVLMLTAMSVAREREQGTFDQLLVTPFRSAEIMAGKALPSMIIGIAQVIIVLIIAQFWFRIPFAGSFVTLFIGLCFFIVAAAGIGLMVSSIASTMQQAMLYNFLLVMPFTLLSGLTTPISSMPVPLQYVTLLNPLRYAIDISQRVYLEGADLSRLLPDLLPLTLISIVTLSGASWMFRRIA